MSTSVEKKKHGHNHYKTEVILKAVEGIFFLFLNNRVIPWTVRSSHGTNHTDVLLLIVKLTSTIFLYMKQN